ncbi:MAG: hypothetical protein ACFFBH_09215 [Promethearchaeota archaeon]
MNPQFDHILYDSLKRIKRHGDFNGSIITKCNDKPNSLIFSDNVKITHSEGMFITKGLKVGFEKAYNKKSAYSKVMDFHWNENLSRIQYCVQIPDDIMHLYSEGQFSDTFPYTLTLLHTATLFLEDYEFKINHLEFFKGEILKNPICLIMNGILIADRVVIDHRGYPVFYDCLIIGRDKSEDLKISYEPLTNVDDKVVKYIIILGIEELRI